MMEENERGGGSGGIGPWGPEWCVCDGLCAIAGCYMQDVPGRTPGLYLEGDWGEMGRALEADARLLWEMQAHAPSHPDSPSSIPPPVPGF